MIRGEIGKIRNKLVTLSKRMSKDDPIFDNIKISLDLFKRRYFCLSRNVDDPLNGLFARQWTVKWTLLRTITVFLTLALN